VVRNVILLLVAFHFEPEEAAEMMLHLWYSILIPEPLFKSLRSKLGHFSEIATTKSWTCRIRWYPRLGPLETPYYALRQRTPSGAFFRPHWIDRLGLRKNCCSNHANVSNVGSLICWTPFYTIFNLIGACRLLSLAVSAASAIWNGSERVGHSSATQQKKLQ
jgi:hypothetical protein